MRNMTVQEHLNYQVDIGLCDSDIAAAVLQFLEGSGVYFDTPMTLEIEDKIEGFLEVLDFFGAVANYRPQVSDDDSLHPNRLRNTRHFQTYPIEKVKAEKVKGGIF